MYYSW